MGNLPASEIDAMSTTSDCFIPLLKHPDWSARESACVTLGKLPADELVKSKDHIVPLLKDR